MKLEGKNTVVTGAASGIGRGIARRFAGEGAQVVCADLDAEGVEKVREPPVPASPIASEVSRGWWGFQTGRAPA